MTKPYQILLGNCRELLRTLPRRSVQCVVTSPPYYGLRDYETEPQVWGGRRHCHHSWWRSREGSTTCRKCGAWRGHLGLEPTPELYVEHLVAVFRGLRRVLRRDGVVWLNLGDSYAGSGAVAGGEQSQTNVGSGGTWRGGSECTQRRHHPPSGLKPKDLVGIPWLVAFALRTDGWYLRSDVIWNKPNPMPESVTDRPTRAHEYLFLLTKHAHYFYDAEAVKEASTGQTGAAAGFVRKTGTKRQVIPHQAAAQHRLERVDSHDHGTRNRRSVWTIPTSPFKDAHFAVFPETLVEPCIKAGTSERGCCPKCGAPWARVTEKPGATPAPRDYKGKNLATDKQSAHRRLLANIHAARKAGAAHDNPFTPRVTLGWQPSCQCNAGAAVPCVVLDPFNGAGTTGAVAVRLRRRYVGLELNADYVRLAQRRLRRAARTPQAQLPTLFEV